MNYFHLASGGNVAGSLGIASTGAVMSTLGKCGSTGNVGGGRKQCCTACTLPGSAG